MKYFWYLGFVFLLFVFSCNAPRENPFDPDASNYYNPESDSVTTTIHFLQLAPGSTVIPFVDVLIPQIHFYGSADAYGTLNFVHLPQDSLTIISMKDGFFTDTSHTSLSNKQNTRITRLNSKPVVSSVLFRSFYENDEFIKDITSLEVQAIINDADGLDDILSVHMLQSEFDFDTTLTLTNSINGQFGRKLLLTDISKTLTPEQLPEVIFNLKISNTDQRFIASQPFHVVRVINESPAFTAPPEGSSQQDSVQFEWTPFHLGYTIHYNIVLHRLESGDEYTFKDIPEDQSVYVVHNLMAGTYFSYLQIEDSFGNICQSSVSNFKFQP